MADIAEIGFRAQTDQLSDAKRKLDDLSPAAGKTERAASRLARMFGVANDNTRKFTDSVKGSNAAVGLLSGGVGRLIGVITTFATTVIAAFSLRPVFAFKDALAEVSTLVDTTTFNMQGLSDAALRLNAQFGGGAATQAKAFYSIISAGASSAAQATEILDASNRLAIGGVTQLETAADGLTSVLNAYGNRVSGATEVSDALFVAMRAGKTTIGELSSGLGQVAPLAATLNVSFDELVASVSALTKGGIATNQAITGVRAVLAAIAKPSAEATKLAKQLGLEFNAAGLEAKGFQGFMDELIQKTGGSTEKLALLFGGVEALVPVMALSGQAGKDFTAIMEQMATKAGATEDAFNKMANSPGFQAARIWASLSTEVIKLTSTLADYLVPAMKLVADNMGNIFKLAGVVGAALLAAFAPAILSAMATGLLGIGYAGVAAMKMLTIAIATNPIGFIAVAISTALTAVYLFRDSLSNVFGSDLTAIIKKSANFIINSFQAAYADLEFIFSNFPQIIGAAIIGAVNAVIGAIEIMLKAGAAAINTLINSVNAIGGAFGMENIGMINPTLPKIDNQPLNELAVANEKHKKTIEEIFKQDPLGAIGGGLDTMTEKLTVATGAAAGLNEQLGGGAGGGDKKKNSYQEIIEGAQRTIAALEAERAAVGLSEEAATRLTRQTDLLNQAKQKNIDLSPRQRDELMKLGAQMAQLETETRKAKDALDFARDGTKSFISDLRKGLMDGKSFWESFKNAAMNALDKIIDRLLNNFIDAIFQANTAASSLGGGNRGGGFLGGIFGIVGKLFGFAKGGAFPKGISGHSNTVVDKPTLFKFASGGGVMGEAGPEAIMPLKRGSDGSLGVQMYSNQGATKTDSPKTIHLEQHYHVEGAISSRDIQQMVQNGMNEAVDTAKRKLPEWQMTYGTDGAVT